MSAHTSANLDLRPFLEAKLGQIAERLRPGVKLTLIMRTPGNTEAEFVASNDDLDAASAVLLRRKEKGL